MTPLTTPIFDFHQVISALTTPLATPTPTPSLVKTILYASFLLSERLEPESGFIQCVILFNKT